MNYRQEIDGLRAVAVIAVIINHTFRDWLPSGYLGVDVFFVISGYVITASLHKQNTRSFKTLIVNFYARRFKRLLPALAVFVAVMALILSWFNPAPAQTLKTGIAALFGVSNLYLLINSLDYFADSTQLNGFTHTWSLGVEEQFYLVFPIIVWATKFGNRPLVSERSFYGVMALSALLSIAGFIFASVHNPSLAYYAMPTRFWELAAGAIVFLRQNPNEGSPKPAIANLAASLLMMIMMGLFSVPIQTAVLTVPAVVLATALLLSFSQPQLLVFQVLSTRPLSYLGRISYSLYLWHWGVLVISRWTIGVYNWTVPLQWLLMLGLAALSYHYIENPLRKAQWGKTPQQTIGYGLLGLVLASGFVLILLKPLKGRLFTGRQPDLMAIGTGSLENDYVMPGTGYIWHGKRCVLGSNSEIGKILPVKDCTLGDFDTAKTRILVIGNSYAASFTAAFEPLVVSDDFAVTITSSWGASPVRELPNDSAWSKANDYYWNQVIPDLVDKLRPGDWVFMISDMGNFSPPKASAEQLQKLALLRQGLKAFAIELQSKQLKLALLHGTPFIREANCEPVIGIKQWFSPFGGACPFISKVQTLARRQPLDQVLSDLQQQGFITVIDLLELFCPGQICNYQTENGVVLYRDVWAHPSMEAAGLAAPVIRQTLNPQAAIRSPEH